MYEGWSFSAVRVLKSILFSFVLFVCIFTVLSGVYERTNVCVCQFGFIQTQFSENSKCWNSVAMMRLLCQLLLFVLYMRCVRGLCMMWRYVFFPFFIHLLHTCECSRYRIIFCSLLFSFFFYFYYEQILLMHIYMYDSVCTVHVRHFNSWQFYLFYFPFLFCWIRLFVLLVSETSYVGCHSI